MAALGKDSAVAVIGAGTMGAGIAQVAAAAGHRVFFYDVAPGAARQAVARLAKGLDKLVERGKMERSDADATIARIEPVESIGGMAGAALAIEAIIENLEIKQKLFAELEAILPENAILATNTSSLSITSIGSTLRLPGRLAGMHFFNPAPVMKLVEVVSGRATHPEVAQTLFDTASAWGKVAVHARSTPGFIVNRVARPFYGEALRLYEEQVADPATIDALMTEGGGFRMGPFELMDLIGHDVNYAVSLSVFNAYYQDPRFRPSLTQLELVNGGHLGRKSGRGFYDYAEGAAKPAPQAEEPDPAAKPFEDFHLGQPADVEGVYIAVTDGRLAREVASKRGYPVILYDVMNADSGAARLGFTASADVPEAVIARFVATLAAKGISTTRLPDWPGLVVLRTIAMLANEGFDAAMQGVASEADIDAAMRFGVNYPKGPMGWAREIGLQRVLSVLEALFRLTGDTRYRASFALRTAAQDEPAAHAENVVYLPV